MIPRVSAFIQRTFSFATHRYLPRREIAVRPASFMPKALSGVLLSRRRICPVSRVQGPCLFLAVACSFFALTQFASNKRVLAEEESSFDRFYGGGVRALNRGDLMCAEQCLSQALRVVAGCLVPESKRDEKKELQCMEQIARFLIQKGGVVEYLRLTGKTEGRNSLYDLLFLG